MRHIITITVFATMFIGLLTFAPTIPHFVSGDVLAATGLGCSRPVDGECPSDSPADPNSPGDAGNDGSGSGGSVNNTAACNGLDQLGGTTCGNNNGEKAVGNVAARAVTIISYIAGIIAIIMIIVAGVKYTTSGGDATKTGSAKTTLIYALIGMAVAALAQFLAHFVISNV